MLTAIQDSLVIKPDFSGFEKTDILIQDDTILEIGKIDRKCDVEIQGEGCFAIPGMIDIHTHGSVGVNYQEVCDFRKALEWNCRNGITTILPTLATRPVEAFLPLIENIRSQSQEPGCASIGGIHFEGPFVSMAKKGAMVNPGAECNLENGRRILEAAGDLAKIMTIAPERENAAELISWGSSHGIRMSVGHTMATFDQTVDAIAAGATGATHCFNAMRAYEHREPGVLGAVLTNDSVTCETICDFVHLAPATVQLIYACKGVDGMILISDSGMMTGLGDGTYYIDGLARYVTNGVSRNAAGNIAGSCFCMLDGARNLLKLGLSLAEIAKVSSYNPAKAIGLDHSIGSLLPGKKADILLTTQDLQLKQVIKNGVCCNV